MGAQVFNTAYQLTALQLTLDRANLLLEFEVELEG